MILPRSERNPRPAHFDGLAPSLVDLVVPRRDKTVLALLFETDRAPFVVKNLQFGSAGVVIEREVPWREGTAVRSARREDLIRILVPQATLPACEVRRAAIEPEDRRGGRAGPPPNDILCKVWLYFEPTSYERAEIPFHRCAGRIRTPGGHWVPLTSLHFEPDHGDLPRPRIRGQPLSMTIHVSATQLQVMGAGGAVFVGTYPLIAPGSGVGGDLRPSLDIDRPLEIDLTIAVSGAERTLRVSALLDRVPPTSAESARWVPPARGSPEGAASETVAHGASESPEKSGSP